MRGLAAGRLNNEIANEIGRSIKTIEGHRARATRKLQSQGLAELVRFATRHGVVEP